MLPEGYSDSATALCSLFREFIRPCKEDETIWKLLNHHSMVKMIKEHRESLENSSKFAGYTPASIRSLILMARNADQTLDDFLEDNEETDSSAIIEALLEKLN